MNRENKENFNIKQVKVGRTREGTIMEALAILLLVVTWVIGLTKHQFVMGEDLLNKCIVFSIVVVMLLVVCYSPKYFNHSRQLRNMRQVLLTIRMSRVLAIEFALMTLFMVISHHLMSSQLEWILMGIIIIGILLTVLVFMILIYKAK